MAGKEKDAAPAVASVAQEVTLDEFCTRLSKTDKRVEMIGGFHHTEMAAGRIKDVEASYAGRYAAFANKPV